MVPLFDLQDSQIASAYDLDTIGEMEDGRIFLFSKEDFFPQVLDACTWEGKLMSIPDSFVLRTIAGRADIVGETNGWNMEDLKAVIESHPDAEMVFDNVPGDYLFEACIRNGLEEFVDFEGKKANLASAEYIEFLN